MKEIHTFETAIWCFGHIINIIKNFFQCIENFYFTFSVTNIAENSRRAAFQSRSLDYHSKFQLKKWGRTGDIKNFLTHGCREIGFYKYDSSHLKLFLGFAILTQENVRLLVLVGPLQLSNEMTLVEFNESGHNSKVV